LQAALEYGEPEWPTTWIAYRLVGAVVTFDRKELIPGGLTQVSLDEVGIPVEAEVLKIGVTTELEGEGTPPFSPP
jgi:hypothetical protein